MAAVHLAFFAMPESGSLEPVLVLEHSAVNPQQQQQQQQQPYNFQPQEQPPEQRPLEQQQQ